MHFLYQLTNDLVTQFCNPIFFTWVLFIVAVFLRFKRKKSATYFFVFIWIWLFIITVSPIPIWLISSLENQNKTLNSIHFKTEKPTYVMVLGSGHTNDTTLSHLNRLGNSAIYRLTEGIRLQHLLPESKLVCSGFSNGKRIPQAKMLALSALEIGFKSKDTVLLTKPSNTEEEAIEFKNRFGSDVNLVICTSAVHMPRALMVFRIHGLNPLPAPTFNYVKQDQEETTKWFSFSSAKIEMMEKSIHEYMGISYIWIRERVR